MGIATTCWRIAFKFNLPLPSLGSIIDYRLLGSKIVYSEFEGSKGSENLN
jgi:hypothetical protein